MSNKGLSGSDNRNLNQDGKEVTATDREVEGVPKRGIDVEVISPLTGSFNLTGLNIALKVTNTTIGNTAVKLPSSPLAQRNSLILQNKGSVSVFIGNSDVTTTGTTQGWEVDAGSYFSVDIRDKIEIYAIADSNVDVKIMEFA